VWGGAGGGGGARHDGAYRFTVGQRRGLGLSGFDEPQYVTAIDGSAVHVGPRSSLQVAALEAEDCSWVAGQPPGDEVALTAQVRYRGEAVPCDIDDLGDGHIRVRFTGDLPLAVAPGQAVVLYDGDVCLGGATIAG
jgi:tRNA-uridine 2-sulfurtransferase